MYNFKKTTQVQYLCCIMFCILRFQGRIVSSC
nr:MAG TPA: hypothetical protein [Bacteriophage sp.]